MVTSEIALFHCDVSRDLVERMMHHMSIDMAFRLYLGLVSALKETQFHTTFLSSSTYGFEYDVGGVQSGENDVGNEGKSVASSSQ